MVELALGVVFRAAVVEAEFLVGEVQSGDEQLEAVGKRVAALGVDLGVVVVIVVAERARWSAWRPVRVLVIRRCWTWLKLMFICHRREARLL